MYISSCCLTAALCICLPPLPQAEEVIPTQVMLFSWLNEELYTWWEHVIWLNFCMDLAYVTHFYLPLIKACHTDKPKPIEENISSISYNKNNDSNVNIVYHRRWQPPGVPQQWFSVTEWGKLEGSGEAQWVGRRRESLWTGFVKTSPGLMGQPQRLSSLGHDTGGECGDVTPTPSMLEIYC